MKCPIPVFINHTLWESTSYTLSQMAFKAGSHFFVGTHFICVFTSVIREKGKIPEICELGLLLVGCEWQKEIECCYLLTCHELYTQEMLLHWFQHRRTLIPVSPPLVSSWQVSFPNHWATVFPISWNLLECRPPLSVFSAKWKLQSRLLIF